MLNTAVRQEKSAASPQIGSRLRLFLAGFIVLFSLSNVSPCFAGTDWNEAPTVCTKEAAAVSPPSRAEKIDLDDVWKVASECAREVRALETERALFLELAAAGSVVLALGLLALLSLLSPRRPFKGVMPRLLVGVVFQILLGLCIGHWGGPLLHEPPSPLDEAARRSACQRALQTYVDEGEQIVRVSNDEQRPTEEVLRAIVSLNGTTPGDRTFDGAVASIVGFFAAWAIAIPLGRLGLRSVRRRRTE